ncbi:MAG: type IV toxin-antitoxin system AbiEi family antitoxin domain-containing protein [Gaiellaceae bacterium]
MKIIAAERKGTLTAAQIKREVKRRGWPSSPKAIETAIHRLVEDGVAVRIRKGVYRFPDLVKQEVRAA